MKRKLFRKTAAFSSFCLAWLILATPLSADEKSDYSFYINALENLKDTKFSNILIDQIREYVMRYPDAQNLDDMQFLIATLYNNNKHELESFVAHTELIYLYPDSKHLEVAKDRVRSLLMRKKKFKPLREQTEAILQPALVDSTSEGRFYSFIKNLFDLRFAPVTKMLIEACDRFLTKYPSTRKSEEVLYWKAELLNLDRQYRQALATYMKLTFLYKKSILVTSSKLRMASLFTNKLEKHQNAILTLEEFLVEYPEDPQAGFALLTMAKIIEKKKKKPLEALEAYLDVAKKYPKSLEAVPALFEAARLYEDKFKEYDQAIRVYTQVVRDFGDDIKAPYALAEAGRIYEKELKDYANAANVYYKIFEQYPDNRLAPEYLYKAAEIYEKKLQDLDQALAHYRKIVDNYPNEKIAEKASKKIDKINKAANHQ
ncbi:MAG: tol-pal system YbgF family protein [bacterium]